MRKKARKARYCKLTSVYVNLDSLSKAYCNLHKHT